MDNELSLDKIKKLFERTPEPYRNTAIRIGKSIIEDNSLDENQKEISIKQLIFKVSSLCSKISTIQRNLGFIWTEEIEESQQEKVRNFLLEAEKKIDEIITNLDVERADELLHEIELAKEYNLKVSEQSKKQERRKTDKKEEVQAKEKIKNKRKLKKPKINKIVKKFVQSDKFKKVLKKLGIAISSGAMALYIGTRGCTWNSV